MTPPRSRLGRLRPLHVRVPVHSAPGGVEVVLHSTTSVPADLLGNGDRRHLGVPVVGVSVSGPVIGRQRAWGSIAGMDRDSMAWLRTYDEVVVNSEFTRRWTQRLWSVDGTVLYPPVRLRPVGPAKEPTITSVGRFFAAERGHSKKQLEMVRAFRRLCDSGVTGWRLELVGGCSPDDRPYLDAVRAEAAGLPVGFHVDVSGAALDDLYARSSIYWHATGLGEDLEADPVRAEHFGITTVEAMSAGAVPVVADGGGPVEVVEEGVSGFAVGTEEGFAERTRVLIDDPGRLSTMARAAAARATYFGVPAFEDRLRAIVDRVLDGAGG